MIWDEDICWSAAQGGHLDVLNWAREHGCPWGMDLCAEAADHGHFHVLKWAREMGCPWDGETLTGQFLGAGAEQRMPSSVQTFIEESKGIVFRLTDSNRIIHDVCYEVVLDIVAEYMTDIIACITDYRGLFDSKSIEMIVTGLSAAEEAMTAADN